MSWFGGKPAGYIGVTHDSYQVSFSIGTRENRKQIRKCFSLGIYRCKDAALQAAKEWQTKKSDQLGLTKNLIRLVEPDVGEPYLKVQLQNGMVMKCDPEDIELVENSIWTAWQGKGRWYARRQETTKQNYAMFHSLVCPDYQEVEHINKDGLDNRHSNLRDKIVYYSKRKQYINIFNKLVKQTNSYDEFHEELSRCTNELKGAVQEIFAKQYFLAYAKLYNVKNYYAKILGDDMPKGINQQDIGTDAAIKHTDGRISFVQVKFRKDYGSCLGRSCLGGMAIEALAENKFKYMYLFANVKFAPKNILPAEKKYIKFLLADKLLTCDWSLIKPLDINSKLQIKTIPPLRQWQIDAHKFVFDGKTSNFGRKTVVAACGSGKTRFASTVINRKTTKKYVYNNALILVPNLYLLSQWFESLALSYSDRTYLLVGSDVDEEGATIPYTLTTDVDEIINIYDSCEYLTCICTYQSLPRLLEANVYFNITVCDEAHVTAGSGAYSMPAQENFISDNILFITATPRVYKGIQHEKCISMDDETIYGPQYIYSFKKAIKENVISDYQIIVGCGKGTSDYVSFNAKFLQQSLEKYGLKSVLVCSSNHMQNKSLYNTFKKIYTGDHELILMPPNANSKQKANVIQKLNIGRSIIIFNVRIFSLGSDMVPLESVMLAGNKSSIIDIVQTVSRCLRKHPNKEFGKILVPCLLETEDFTGPGTFPTVRSFLSAMATVDSSIIDKVILRRKGESGNKIITDMIIGSVETNTDYADIKFNFDLMLYNSLGESLAFLPYIKCNLLYRYCTKKGVVPGQRVIYKGKNIGRFLCDLLGGTRYKKNRDDWINQLLSIESIKDKLQERIKNISDGAAKVSRKIKPIERQKALVAFCIKNKRFPKKGELFNGIKISSFLCDLLGGSAYKEKRQEWINQLLRIESIKNKLQERIKNISGGAAKASRKIKPIERQKALVAFCIKNKQHPTQEELFNGIKVGKFLDHLLESRYYKKNRNDWIKQLLRIESIKDKLQERIKNISDDAAKTSRKIKPIERQKALVVFCLKKKRFPKQGELFNGIKVFTFLCDLLGGTRYKKNRDDWIKQLLSIESIKDKLQERIKNISDGAAKVSRKIKPIERQKALVAFCIKNKQTPTQEELFNGIKVGSFFYNLLGGTRYKKNRDDWIKQLLSIENIKDELQKRLESRGWYKS